MIDTRGIEAALAARDAAIQHIESTYGMAGLRRPFSAGERRFNHLFAPDPTSNLSLCAGLAVVNRHKLRPAKLYEIDCLACLEAFTERYRGRGVQ